MNSGGQSAPVTVWHLQMTDPARFVPSTQAPRYRLERVTAPSAPFARYLYEITGAAWRWIDRLPWTEDQWAARLADPSVELWVAYDGGAPMGYFELGRHPDGDTVEIVYFGLLPHAVGSGQGGALLTDAVRRAWEMGARRVYVNTCSKDHPAARGNYERRGFEMFREEIRGAG